MSGPKTSSYDIERARRLEEEARRRVLGEARLLVDRSAALAARIEGLRSTYGDLEVTAPVLLAPESGDRPALERFCADAEARLAAASDALEQALHGARRTAVLAALNEVADLGGPVDADVDGLLAQAAAAEHRSEAAAARRRRVEGAIEEIAALADADQLALRDALAGAVSEVAPERQQHLLTQLESMIDHARQRQRAAARSRRRAEDLLAEALGYDDDELGPLVADLRAVRDGARPLTEAEESAARHALAAAGRRADDRLVRTAIADALEDLGYEVDQGFETLAPGEHLDLTRTGSPDWAGYAVRARADDAGGIRWHLVRDASVQPTGAGDAARETSWCQDLASVHQQLAELGVATEITASMAAGEVPVMVAATEAARSAPGARRRTRRRRADRSREHGR